MVKDDIKLLALIYNTRDIKECAKNTGLKESQIKAKIEDIEARLGLSIVRFDSNEVQFTDAGRSIAEDSLFLIRYANTALEKARGIEKEDKMFIKIGSSFFTPTDEILKRLKKNKEKIKPYEFKCVHFFSLSETLKNLGDRVDIITTHYDEKMLKKYSLSSFEFKKEKVAIALSASSGLSAYPILDIEDLYGKKLYLLKKGMLKAFDQIRADISLYHKEIEIVSYDTFDQSLENRIEEEGSALASFSSLSSSFTHLVFKPVLWNYSSDFGLLYKETGSEKISKTLKALNNG